MFPRIASDNLDLCHICPKEFENLRLPAYFVLNCAERLFCSLEENLPLEHLIIIREYRNPFPHHYKI